MCVCLRISERVIKLEIFRNTLRVMNYSALEIVKLQLVYEIDICGYNLTFEMLEK